MSDTAFQNSSTTTQDVCGYCAGKPRTLVSSHSGTITLAVSLQEPVVFLSGAQPQSPGSYREHDNREASASTHASTVDDGAADGTNGTSGERNSGDESNNGSNNHRVSELPPAILRGSILLKLTKPTKLKSLSLSFYGRCKTSWNQNPSNPYDDSIAAHPLAEIQDELVINSHNWEFMSKECFNGPNDGGGDSGVTTVCTDLYGADVVKFKNEDEIRFKSVSESKVVHNDSSQLVQSNNTEIPLFVSSPQSNRRKSIFNNSSDKNHKESIQFPAGEYVYNFTLAIDSKVPESVNAPKGTLNYFLVPKVVRAGAFALNLSGYQPVDLVRQPPNNCDSLSNNPIAISRNWDNRLHYEILIPKKYISLGSSIPMAIKLTPLEKVMVHRVRVHVVESVQYIYSQDSSLNYTDKSLKILLYEKKASSTPSSKGAQSSTSKVSSSTAVEDDMSTQQQPHGLLHHFPLKKDHHHHNHHHGTSTNEKRKKTGNREKFTGNLLHYTTPLDDLGGGAAHSDSPTPPLPASSSSSNGADAALRDQHPEDAAATTIDCTLPLISGTSHFQGGLGSENNLFNKATASETYIKNLHPDTFNCPYIKVRHRLTISFRISKQDADDAKRRHFEVKIDTPIHFLSKHCVNENVDLPDYDLVTCGGLGGEPLTLISSNDSNYPISTVALPQQPPLPTFDTVMLAGDSDSDGLLSASPPPDYETIVGNQH